MLKLSSDTWCHAGLLVLVKVLVCRGEKGNWGWRNTGCYLAISEL